MENILKVFHGNVNMKRRFHGRLERVFGYFKKLRKGYSSLVLVKQCEMCLRVLNNCSRYAMDLLRNLDSVKMLSSSIGLLWAASLLFFPPKIQSTSSQRFQSF